MFVFESRGVERSLKSEKKNNYHGFLLQDANSMIIMDILIPDSASIYKMWLEDSIIYWFSVFSLTCWWILQSIAVALIDFKQSWNSVVSAHPKWL